MINFYIFIFLLLPIVLHANPLACPVCTFAIAGGLGLSRLLGVNDMVVGIWAGAGLLALSQWTVYFFEKKSIKNIIVKVLCYICWYSLLIPLYIGSNQSLIFNATTIFGIDSFIFSVLIGSLVLAGSVKLYYYMKQKNNNKPHFPYEKVALPILSLIVASIIIFIITKG